MLRIYDPNRGDDDDFSLEYRSHQELWWELEGLFTFMYGASPEAMEGFVARAKECIAQLQRYGYDLTFEEWLAGQNDEHGTSISPERAKEQLEAERRKEGKLASMAGDIKNWFFKRILNF